MKLQSFLSPGRKVVAAGAASGNVGFVQIIKAVLVVDAYREGVRAQTTVLKASLPAHSTQARREGL